MRSALAILVLLAATSFSWSEDDIAITAKKKTMRTSEAVKRNLLRAQPPSSENSMFVQFEMKANTAAPHDALTAQWMILVKDGQGQIRHGTSGEKEVHLAEGTSTSLRTDTFALKKSPAQVNGEQRMVEDGFYGYGIKLLGANGDEISSAYYPKGAEAKIQDLEKRRARRHDRMRRMLPTDRSEMIRNKDSKASRLQPDDVNMEDLVPRPLTTDR